MKILRKKIKFDRKPEQDMYEEKFSSYKDFYDTVISRQLNARRTLEELLSDGGTSWVGVQSVDQAKDLFLNGWQQNVEKMKIAFKKELDTLEHDRPKKLVNSVSGFIPIVPNALLGLPNSMIDVKMSPKKSKILNFMVSLSKAGGNSVEDIIKKMSKIFAYVAMLERSGQYRCRISCFYKASSPSDMMDTFASFSVLIKNENQLFDIKRLCFPIIHPAMLRLFAFAWAESLPIKENYRASGYGMAFEHWKEEDKKIFMDALTENNEKTICLDLHSDIEEVLGKEVA